MRPDQGHFERLTQLAIERTSEGVFAFGDDGRFHYVNDAACRLLGYSRDELLARTVEDIDPHYRGARLGDKVAEARAEGSASFESVHQAKDGSLIPVAITVTELRDEGRPFFFAQVQDLSERKRAEAALRASEKRFRELFENIPVGLYKSTADGRLLEVNPAMIELLGYPDRDTLLAVEVSELYADPTARDELMRALGEQGVVQDLEVRLRRHDGRVIWARLNVRALSGDEGEELCYEGTIEEITEWKRAQQALKEREVRFRSLVQNASDLVSLLDAEGRVLYESPAHERLLGYPVEERRGREVMDLVHSEDRDRVRGVLGKLIREPGATRSVQYRFRHRDGSYRVFESVGTNLLDNPAVEGIVVNSRDVTERTEAEQRLRHLALFDPLTNLPNRTSFLERLRETLEQARQGTGGQLAVLFLDLDRFKDVNDSLGHVLGDRLLVEIASRLQASLEGTESIARVGGDEFLILMTDVDGTGSAVRLAEHIHALLEEPLYVEGHELFRTTSIGIVVGRAEHRTAESFLRDADTAMHRAKARGGAGHVVFDRAMHRRALERLRLETELRRALEREELEVVYQPIFRLRTGTVVGLEALVRWRSPSRGLVLPEDFLQVAEVTGMIREVDEQVLRQAVSQLSHWRRLSVEEPFFVSVNFSQHTLSHPGCVERVNALMASCSVEPQELALEITEGSFFENPEAAASTFSQLRELGVRLLLDDFGTGYSSLSYLHRFPIDTLKVDRSFIGRLHRGEQEPEILLAILTLGRSLGLGVVAEGVETIEQATRLEELGCDLGQGNLFSVPVAAEAVADLLGSRLPADGPEGWGGHERQAGEQGPP